MAPEVGGALLKGISVGIVTGVESITHLISAKGILTSKL